MYQPLRSLLTIDHSQSVLSGFNMSSVRSYSPFGSGATPSALGFRGALSMLNSAHYELGNGYRIYNPALMRFHKPDSMSPFGSGGLNAYAYCNGDPVNFQDPTGHMPVNLGVVSAKKIKKLARFSGVADIPEGVKLGHRSYAKNYFAKKPSPITSRLRDLEVAEMTEQLDTAYTYTRMSMQGDFDGLYTPYVPQSLSWSLDDAAAVMANVHSNYAGYFGGKIIIDNKYYGRPTLLTWHFEAAIDASQVMIRHGDISMYRYRNRMIMQKQKYVIANYHHLSGAKNSIRST